MTTAAADGLQVDVRLRRGPLDLDVALTAAPGEVVAVVGPNGAGKSTLLQLVAGLLDPDDGRIALDGTALVDTAAGARTDPADRGVGVVFQDLLLFDHLSVRDNVAFGPRSRGAGRRAAAAAAEGWLARVGLADRAGARPRALSGGQRQRVALARALAADPRCLILDEPLSALDAQTRTAVRRELRDHLGGFAGPVLLVTHEPLEALALADRLVVLEGGRVTQAGTAADVARHPRSEWVSRLLGVNLLAGTARGGQVALDGGGALTVPGDAPQGEVLVSLHPRSVSLHLERPAGSPRNVWRTQVAEVELAGDRVRVQLAAPIPLVAEVTAAALAELGLEVGGQVWAALKASEVQVYPR